MSTSLIQRLEHLTMSLLTLVAYIHFGGSAWLFAAGFLVPDLAMLGYLGGPRLGALCYNLAHSFALALPLTALGVTLNQPWLIWAGLIWVFHIAFDRSLGYGLKEPTDFKDTHLGRLSGGKPARA